MAVDPLQDTLGSSFKCNTRSPQGNLANPPEMTLGPYFHQCAVCSPGLNPYGNSRLGIETMERLTTHTGWSVVGTGTR